MRSALFLCCCCAAFAPCFAAEPRVLVDGYKLELVAHEPEIVTPIGMAFDGKGRLLVIESHTHQRPEGYQGPAGDRIRMLSDSDGDGKLDTWSTFAEGFQQAMNLCTSPSGGVYVVTRRDVRLLEDVDGDGTAERDTPILRLETEAEYPHNGLGAVHFAAGEDDKPVLYIGLGENFGSPYRLVGSDERAISGRAGVGTIFSCALDGSKLQRVAAGFWNPFSICTLGKELFCVENDPDSSPPCRLIHIVPTGDYGHRWEYGRAGVHPLQAWNGELPGTLPMVCGVGEAPTAIVAHRGFLWVTSWGDHRIERYELIPNDASFTAKCEVVVQGDADFRPTGMAVAPDGSLYFGDWVDRSYPVHGKGRVWRLQVAPGQVPTDVEPRRQLSDADLMTGADSDDPFVRQRTVRYWSKTRPWTQLAWDDLSARKRLVFMQAMRWDELAVDEATATLRKALVDPEGDVRLYAVRWIADERINELRDDVAKLLDGPMPSERYFLCVLAAIEWLDGDASPRTSGISDGLLRRELANEKRSPELHALALRLISPDHEWLTIERLRGWLASDSPALRVEAVRTLAMQSKPERFSVLVGVAGDAKYDGQVRAEAIVGLAADMAGQGVLLERLATVNDATVANEAKRAIRLSRQRELAKNDLPLTDDLAKWTTLLAEGGDAAAGRRLFFLPGIGAQCAACHQHGGRGGRVGPDLTQIGKQQARERIIASVLQPSREIAPAYQAWSLLTTDGLTHAGLKLPKGGDDGVEVYADPQGREFRLKSEEIEQRSPNDKSIMPEGLQRTLSVEDLRDIVAFLMAEPETSR